MAFMFVPASLMLARSFQVDSYGMGFGIANISTACVVGSR